jgi:HK97 family phage portal protein
MAGIFGAIARGIETKAVDASALTWERLFGAPSSKAGVSVNLNSALKVTTVLACARVLAEGCAMLPFKVYEEAADGGKTPAVDNAVYRLIYERPNDWMTAFEFRETLTLHAVLAKGGYAFINWVGDKPVELLPLVPGNVTVKQDPDTWVVEYDVRDPKGGLIGTYPRGNILHLRGPSWDSVCALEAITMAREAIGLAIAAEETHARLHQNGAQPGGILTVKGGLTEEAKVRLRESWKQYQEGVHNRFKTAVLDQDATWTPMAMTGVDAQHLETRRFQIEEICRGLKVFPQMIGYSDKTATFASAEAFFQAHVTHSLMPWLIRWEQVVARDLLKSKRGVLAKHTVLALLRGNAQDRANYYKAALGAGNSEPWMEVNEVRGLEELNPVAWGYGRPLVSTRLQPDPAADQNPDDPANDPAADPSGKSREIKIGRRLSSENEGRIRNAKGELDAVLSSLPSGDDA